MNIFEESGGVLTLRNSPTADDLERKFHLGACKGFQSGFILFAIWKLTGENIRGGASVNKAIHILESTDPKFEEFGTIIGAKIPFNEKSIRQGWAEYKSVAHLWAAYMYWVGCDQPEKSHPISKSHLSRLLSIAEAFRNFGENHFPHGQKEPTLNFKNEDNEKIIINSNDTNQYYKKVVKPTEAELKLHKEYLKNNLKKNFFN